jgi:hypothetical protein
MFRISSAVALLVATPLLAACSDNLASPEVQECDAGASAVSATIGVNNSGVVTFDWAPACGMMLLLVEEEGSDMWAINAPESSWGSPSAANIILPPVTYGQVPAGTVADFPASHLVPGVTYELVLWRILPDGNAGSGCMLMFDSACLAAVKEFTR